MFDVYRKLTVTVNHFKPNQNLLKRLRTIASGSTTASLYTTELVVHHSYAGFDVLPSRWNLVAKRRQASFEREFWKVVPKAISALRGLRSFR